MDGGVSLAAALAVPLHREDGTPFPGRDLIILIAGAVILTTLVMQGISLPWLLRRLGLKSENFQAEETAARLLAAQAVLAWLDEREGDDNDGDAAQSVRVLYEAKARRLEFTTRSRQRLDGGGEPDAENETTYVALRLAALHVERGEILQLRHDGRINAPVLRAIERGFDLQESRLSDR